MAAKSTEPSPSSIGPLEEAAAIAAIDRLLANLGIQHGSRRTLRPRKSSGRQRSLVSPARAPRRVAAASVAAVPLQVAAWRQQHPWLRHGFSTRAGGITAVYQPLSPLRELNLGFTPADAPANVEENRKRLIKAVAGREGAKAKSLVTLQQIHSSIIRQVKGFVPLVQRGDGLLTQEPGVLLGILSADCVPVLVADTRQRIVGAFHAGWRGTLARIVECGIGRMRAEFGSRPEDLTGAIGPRIGQCCYAVGEELRFDFESQFAYADSLFREVYDSDPIREKYPLLFMTARAPGHWNLGPNLHLDLAGANQRQLLAAGVPERSIHFVGGCTACHPEQFFSHRAQQGFTGRMMSVIGVAA